MSKINPAAQIVIWARRDNNKPNLRRLTITCGHSTDRLAIFRELRDTCYPETVSDKLFTSKAINTSTFEGVLRLMRINAVPWGISVLTVHDVLN